MVAQEQPDGWTIARCNNSSGSPSDLQLFTGVDEIETMIHIFNYGPESEPQPDAGWEQVQHDDLAS